MKNRFNGAKPSAIWRILKGGILAAGGLLLAAANVATPKLLAVQWVVNSQSAAQTETNVVVTANLQTVTNQFVAYAQVEPITVLPVRSAEVGVVTGLEIVPGRVVQTGQKLAELGGPEIESALAQAEAAVRSARTNLLAAQKSLAIEREQLASHLVTRQMVLQSEGAAAQAQGAFDTAQTQLRALRQTITLTAPAAGTVLTVDAADGERVSAGETILTLQPADKLWLKAAYYGADAAAIHAGMSGEFSPAEGSESVPVKVTTVFGALNPDGGESIGLLAEVPSPGWLNGQFGTVTLNGSVRQMVAVPTRTLILDQGQWWVLVHTARGNQRQAVTPGPARGWQTFIERGLQPGAEVVVKNAYLEFHRGISKNYMPPD